MRILVLLSLTFVFFCNCSTETRSSENGANQKSPTSNIVADNSKNPDAAQNRIGEATNFTVDEYEDNQLVRRLSFRNGLLIKAIGYNTETAIQESEAEYFYTNDGKFSRVEVKSEDESKEANLAANKAARDFIVQNEFLRSKDVEFPVPDIVADEVNNISNIFSVASDSSDVKTETHNSGNRKVIKFIRFNKTVRFEPSMITLVIGNNPIHIKNYEIILENRYPAKEVLTTESGELVKMFIYKDGRLVRLIYKFTDDESHTSILETRFEYSELR